MQPHVLDEWENGWGFWPLLTLTLQAIIAFTLGITFFILAMVKGCAVLAICFALPQQTVAKLIG